jgi:radical SAM superfamily enzyme YgiQ (UPF0313 family)
MLGRSLFIDVVKRDGSNTVFEHLGIMYLQGTLKKAGYESNIFSTRFESEKHLYEKVRKGNYGLIGLSVMQIDAKRAMRIVRGLREIGYNGYIVMGGHWPNFHPQEILQHHPEVDFVLTGEADYAIVQLAQALDHGALGLDKVSGLAYREGNAIKITPHFAVPDDLDLLPFPLRNQYTEYLRRNGNAVSISGSRGCFAHCTFCDIVTFHRKIKAKAYRARSNENICNEIESLGLDRVEFVDDQFVDWGEAGKARAYAFADEVERRKLKFEFAALARVDTIDKDLFKRLRQVGLRRVLLGIEAASRDDLKVLGKHITPEQSRKAIQILDEVGIESYVSMIMVNPYSTFETVRQNLEFLVEVSPYIHSDKASLSLNTMQIFSGTPIWQRLKNEKRLTGDYLGFDYKRNNFFARIVELWVDYWLNGLKVQIGQCKNWLRRTLKSLTSGSVFRGSAIPSH